MSTILSIKPRTSTSSSSAVNAPTILRSEHPGESYRGIFVRFSSPAITGKPGLRMARRYISCRGEHYHIRGSLVDARTKKTFEDESTATNNGKVDQRNPGVYFLFLGKGLPFGGIGQSGCHLLDFDLLGSVSSTHPFRSYTINIRVLCSTGVRFGNTYL